MTSLNNIDYLIPLAIGGLVYIPAVMGECKQDNDAHGKPHIYLNVTLSNSLCADKGLLVVSGQRNAFMLTRGDDITRAAELGEDDDIGRFIITMTYEKYIQMIDFCKESNHSGLLFGEGNYHVIPYNKSQIEELQREGGNVYQFHPDNVIPASHKKKAVSADAKTWEAIKKRPALPLILVGLLIFWLGASSIDTGAPTFGFISIVTGLFLSGSGALLLLIKWLKYLFKVASKG
ncbi:TPA: hypothetical protein R4Y92_002750 [Klebsiella aerogenes]|nr:hypothetical protein [Klebsiella aerogenes]